MSDDNTEKLKNQTALIFYNSGTCSHIAVEKLKEHGFKSVFNLGSFTRAKKLMATIAELDNREHDGGEEHLYFVKNTHA